VDAGALGEIDVARDDVGRGAVIDGERDAPVGGGPVENDLAGARMGRRDRR
jgi:hypothetical protein